MNSNIIPTFLDYNKSYDSTEIIFHPQEAIKKIGLLGREHFLNFLPSVVFIVDYRNGKYLYTNQFSEHLFGYHRDIYMDKGSEFFLSKLHPKDFECLNFQIFKKMYGYLQQNPNVEFRNIRFSFNMRYRRRDGSLFQIMQQSTFIECDQFNRPLLNLGIISDISHLKSDPKINLSISDISTGELISSDHFAESEILTRREKEILDKIILGMNSAQIAEHYFISEQTVKIHRKNMLEKASAKNMPEMIRLATVNGWI